MTHLMRQMNKHVNNNLLLNVILTFCIILTLFQLPVLKFLGLHELVKRQNKPLIALQKADCEMYSISHFFLKLLIFKLKSKLIHLRISCSGSFQLPKYRHLAKLQMKQRSPTLISTCQDYETPTLCYQSLVGGLDTLGLLKQHQTPKLSNHITLLVTEITSRLLD